MSKGKSPNVRASAWEVVQVAAAAFCLRFVDSRSGSTALSQSECALNTVTALEEEKEEREED